eukprot:15431368-Alexandrium_andersonii.AAC.1
MEPVQIEGVRPPPTLPCREEIGVGAHPEAQGQRLQHGRSQACDTPSTLDKMCACTVAQAQCPCGIASP